MAKKKKIKRKPRPTIEPVDYWQYRLTIEAMEHEETRELMIAAQKRVHALEQEMAALKVFYCESTLKRQKETSELAKAEYGEIKKGIETKLGFDLVNCEIDPHTYEVNRG